MSTRHLAAETVGFLVVLTLAAFIPLALSALIGP